MVRYEAGADLQLAQRPRAGGFYLKRAPGWAFKKGGGGQLSDKQMAINEKFGEVATECNKEVSGLTGNSRVEAFNSCVKRKMS